jgi:hypothetical protein
VTTGTVVVPVTLNVLEVPPVAKPTDVDVGEERDEDKAALLGLGLKAVSIESGPPKILR